MKKLLPFLFLILSLSVKGQETDTVQTIQNFGVIDKKDLRMKVCDFEKDANAEILFDIQLLSYSGGLHLQRHKRIKIFNEKGMAQGNVRLAFVGYKSDIMKYLKAETINLNGDKIEITPVEKSLFYVQTENRFFSIVSFTFPKMQAGSVIEYEYAQGLSSLTDIDPWFFQNNIPTRCSQLVTDIPESVNYRTFIRVRHPFFISTSNVKSMVNIPSLQDEPYMTCRQDNLERITIRSTRDLDSWKNVGIRADGYDYFGMQFGRGLKGENQILKDVKKLSDVDKVAYIFKEVKNHMKWNGINATYTQDGTSEAWNKGTGNATEINLILYHLLHEADLKAYPMLVSTRDHGKVNHNYPREMQFNRAVVYVPLGNDYYVLDATNKYNLLDRIPYELLNGEGFYFDRSEDKYDLLVMTDQTPVLQTISINADIMPGAKLKGEAHINSYSYNRVNLLKNYNTDGEKKYIQYLADNDNALKISSLKLENMEVDSLPLVQNVQFEQDLSGSDENYIYVNSNLFTSLHQNPFISDNRNTDIDFGYLKSLMLNGTYKLPAGYKVDAIPESISMTMPDKSITFKRITGVDDGKIVLHYFISFKKAIYFREDYPEFHSFFKKMYEMLNEPIVLKKA